MHSQITTKKHGFGYERLAAVILGLLAIGIFAFHAYSFNEKTTTQRETALFGILEFLLTLGFGWFSTRAASRAEFERSLKQFAISAYRRIRDIEGMIERLRERLQGEELGTGESATHNHEVVRAVLEDTLLVVRSSTSDWADVIGDELLALQTINRLRREKTELQSAPTLAKSVSSAEVKIAEIDGRIQDLIKRLPPNLQLASRQREDDVRQRDHYVDWMKQRHQEENGLRLRVVAGGNYKCDGDVKKIAPETELVISIEPDGVEIRDFAQTILGRVLNNSPLDYSDFMRTLAETFGTRTVPARFSEYENSRTTDKGVVHHWYKVKVTSEPVEVRQPMDVGLRRRSRGQSRSASQE